MIFYIRYGEVCQHSFHVCKTKSDKIKEDDTFIAIMPYKSQIKVLSISHNEVPYGVVLGIVMYNVHI